MTDNDIIKALECCRNNERDDTCRYCSPCTVGDMEDFDSEREKNCIDYMLTRAIDLINRQKAEIERLNDVVKPHPTS